MSADNDQHARPIPRCAIEVWTTARGAAQHRTRITDECDDALADEVVDRAVRTHHSVAAKLAAGPELFEGQAPPGRAAGHVVPAAYVRAGVPATLLENAT